MNVQRQTMEAFPVDRTSPLPFYHQIKEWFYASLGQGHLNPGDQVPSEADLCEHFQVSRTVIRQALNDLVNEGRLYRWKGKGTFVARAKIGESVLQRLTSFYQDMHDRGFEVATRVLELGVMPASTVVAEELGIKPGQEVVRLVRLRLVDGEPIMLATNYLPHYLCPNILEEDLSTGSLYALLASKYGLTLARGRRSFEAEAASEEDAELLGIEPGGPIAFLRGVFYLDDGRAVEYSEAKHRGDRSRFEVEVRPAPGAEAGASSTPPPCLDLPSSNDIKTTS